MSFIKNIFNIQENFSGLIFKNNKIKIIKLEKEEENFFPLYWNELDFDLENLLEKSEMINFFKKIKSNLKTNKINIQIISNEYKKKEIISNLKIAGFQEINIRDFQDNIKNLVIDKENIERTIFAEFQEENINFYFLEEKYIYKKESISFSDLNKEKIEKLFEGIDHKHIFISGNFKNKLEEIKKIFYYSGIKVHIFNIWKNILSFEKEIPMLFKGESHEYLNVISITLPILEKIIFEKEKQEELKKEKKKDKKEKINVDFIIDNKKESKIIFEKYSIWESLQNILNKILWGPKDSKSFRKYSGKKSTSIGGEKDKIFLPKLKRKLYLPRPKNNFLDSKHSFKLISSKRKKKDKKKNLTKSKNKIFLKKPKKIILLPWKTTRTAWEKIIIFLNQPIFENKKKKK